MTHLVSLMQTAVRVCLLVTVAANDCCKGPESATPLRSGPLAGVRHWVRRIDYSLAL